MSYISIPPSLHSLIEQFKTIGFKKCVLWYRDMSIQVALLCLLTDMHSDSSVNKFKDFEKYGVSKSKIFHWHLDGKLKQVELKKKTFGMSRYFMTNTFFWQFWSAWNKIKNFPFQIFQHRWKSFRRKKWSSKSSHKLWINTSLKSGSNPY